MSTQNTAMVVQQKQGLTTVDYSEDQVALVRDTIAKGCTELELKLFLQVAKIKRLDPFTGQIRPMKRWDSSLGRETMTVQTGVDGYRVIAARTDELAGSDDPIYDSDDEDHPKWAKVTVYRWSNGQRIPYTSTARWNEYVQRKKDGSVNSMWTRMPYLMLGKVAECLALRKAFPDELSGIYTFEEMGQADNPDPTEPQSRKPVEQPTRASEKREEKKEPGLVEVSGIIDTAKPGKDDSLWIRIGKEIIAVPPERRDANMQAGWFLKCLGIEKVGNNIGKFYQLEKVVELSEVQDAEPEPQQEPESKPEQAQEEPQGLAGLFESGQVKTAADLPEGSGKKPGSIGLARAKRLYALTNQNKKSNNGLTEENIKRVLAALPEPVEHLRDLPVVLHDQFEKWCVGEEDWREFVAESERLRAKQQK